MRKKNILVSKYTNNLYVYPGNKENSHRATVGALAYNNEYVIAQFILNAKKIKKKKEIMKCQLPPCGVSFNMHLASTYIAVNKAFVFFSALVLSGNYETQSSKHTELSRSHVKPSAGLCWADNIKREKTEF